MRSSNQLLKMYFAELGTIEIEILSLLESKVTATTADELGQEIITSNTLIENLKKRLLLQFQESLQQSYTYF